MVVRSARVSIVAGALVATSALAEVVPHGSGTALPGSASVGPGGLVRGGAITVPGDIGELARSNGSANLFHSFSVFNVFGTLGESVTFTAPSDPGVNVSNVISRVTGGTSALTGSQASVIDGSLRSAIAGANFFLVNPNGVIFGPNAAISVNGAFFASTADAVHLADGGTFYADPNEVSTLTAAPPEAFGFLGSNPASIRVLNNAFLIPETPPFFPATLDLPDGAEFGLVGGDVDVGIGWIGHPAGTVQLASAAGPGRAVLTDGGIDMSDISSLGTVRVTGPHIIDAHKVHIRAGRFELRDAVIAPRALASRFGVPKQPPNGVLDGIVEGVVDVEVRERFDVSGSAGIFGTGLRPGISAFTDPSNSEGPEVPGIRVDADTVTLTGGAQIRSDRRSPGDVGPITVNARIIEIRDGANISSGNRAGSLTATRPTGGADVSIRATERLLLDGSADTPFTGIAAEATDNGTWFVVDSGDISIDVSGGRFEVRNSAQVSGDSRSFGVAGDISIIADEILLSRDGASVGGITSQSLLAGDAGNIDIETRTLEIRDGFQISTRVAGTGDAGGVNVLARESIVINGDNSGILSAAEGLRLEDLPPGLNPALLPLIFNFFGLSASDGDGGAITLESPKLVMNDDTTINSSTIGGGDGGSITGRFGQLELNDTARIRAQSGELDRNTLEPRVGSGNGGRVSIEASTVSLSGASADKQAGISTSTLGVGDAGQIDVLADVVLLSDGATISSESTGEGVPAGETPGVAGEVRIEARDRIVLHRAEITTDATRSDGGNIELIAVNLLDMLDSRITTSVGAAASGGSITIDPIFIILQNSEITANAEFGPGGQIQLTADQIIIDEESSVSARSLFNPELDGEVVVNAPESDLIAGITVLPGSFLDASSLLTSACQSARGGSGGNSLALVGRGGVPVDPDGYLPSLAIAGVAPAAGTALSDLAPPQQLAMLASVSCSR